MTFPRLCSEAAIISLQQPQRPRRDRVAATVRYRRYEVLTSAPRSETLAHARRSVAQLFSEAGVYDYVTELYDLLHLSSNERALDDIETYLTAKGYSLC